jgi:hypothetical protein
MYFYTRTFDKFGYLFTITQPCICCCRLFNMSILSCVVYTDFSCSTRVIHAFLGKIESSKQCGYNFIEVSRSEHSVNNSLPDFAQATM